MNGGIASGVYRRVPFNRKIVWSSGQTLRFQTSELAYDLTASPTAVLESAGDVEAVSEICRRVLAGLLDGGVRSEDALYVIGEADNPTVCKIGYSCKPIDRLMQLQMATWRELRLYATFFPVKARIASLEQAIHAEAAAVGYGVRGEWLCLSPKAAVEFVMEVAAKCKAELCGPDVWLDNLASRVAGLRKEQIRLQTAA